MISFKTQIRVHGLKRSGNHAILNWLLSQHDITKVFFINDVGLGKNPLVKRKNGIPILEYGPDQLPCIKKLLKDPKNKELKRDILLYSQEDNDLYEYMEKTHNNQIKWNLHHSNKYDIFILRDPLNCFTSRYLFEDKADKYQPRISCPERYKEVVDLWKQYAKFCLDIEKQSSIDSILIFINYNKWCINKKYRKNISAKFKDASFNDKTINQVPGYGWGSSFGKLKLKTFNKDRKILFERYKQMPMWLYRSLIEDDELLNLSTKLFKIEYKLD